MDGSTMTLTETWQIYFMRMTDERPGKVWTTKSDRLISSCTYAVSAPGITSQSKPLDPQRNPPWYPCQGSAKPCRTICKVSAGHGIAGAQTPKSLQETDFPPIGFAGCSHTSSISCSEIQSQQALF
eukprot:458716-Rhodomonas_salina.1